MATCQFQFRKPKSRQFISFTVRSFVGTLAFMSRAEKYLPFILALLGPAVGMINNSIDLTGKEVLEIAFRYLEASLFLLLIWYLNYWLLNGQYRLKEMLGVNTTAVIVNALVIGSITLLDQLVKSYGLGTIMPAWLLAVRLSLITLIFNIVLRIFKAQKESTALKFQNLSLQAENLKFQIDLMKQQINPHFLFNSLNTLLDLIEEDTKSAVKYVRNFSSLYRVVLQSAKHDFIPLADELSFLNDYWNLLKVRFRDAIDLEVQIAEGLEEALIPPLSLQFIIENAVKHNEASTRTPLLITIREDSSTLIISNKINLKNYPVVSEKVGLKNLQQRFTLLHRPIEYGKEDEEFVVRIPLKTS